MKLFLPTLCLQANLIAAAFCCVLTGCGGSEVSTVPVHGKVSISGKPLPAGIITFVPTNIATGLPNRTPQGASQADGASSLSTFRPDDGAVPGDYSVCIQAAQAPVPVDDYSKAPAAPAGPKIPTIYSNADSTPLKASVPAAGLA